MKKSLFLICLSLKTCLIFAQTDTEKSLNGIWEMNGYGRIIEISEQEVNTYDVTEISCIQNSNLKRNEINHLGKFEQINKDSLNLKLGITNYYLHRIKELPKGKGIGDSIQSKNIKLNFDVFWYTLNENYAFFKERKLNWQEVYETYKMRVDTLKSEQELYEIFREITDRLADEHTSVRPTEEIRSTYDEKMESLEESRTSPNLSVAELEENILNKYVKDPVKYGRSIRGNGLINYGITKNNMGYIQLNNMLFFSDYKIPDTLTGYDYLFAYLEESGNNPTYQEDEIKGIKRLMDSILVQFKNTDGLILDLRFNYGGYEVVSLEILSHFITEKSEVFSKKAKTVTGFTKPQSFTITPAKNTYNKPVFLLTSHQTSSAPESLVMASMPFKNIKTIGSRTMGITSDVLEKKLPNGWDVFLSNEIQVNYKGNCYEGIGVPPDIKINYPKDQNLFIEHLDARLKNGDEAIEKAFKCMKRK